MNSPLWRTARQYVLGVALVVIVCSLSSSAAAQSLTLTPEQKFLQQVNAEFQTITRVGLVGEWVRIQDWSYPLPPTSQNLPMKADEKIDGWGKPFCIIQIGERVAVVSGGPSLFSCDALPLSPKQIAESKTDHFITSSKLVVYIIRRARNLHLWAD